MHSEQTRGRVDIASGAQEFEHRVGAVSWIDARFAGESAGSSCGTIPEGNPLTSDL
ncbi:hypothetical protein ACFYO7_28595 [Nocardia salmonicida]|uniref:hypothetical protein n=1 Tax=Nocardia salmonicida TaxID=53431 RepID=UPI003698BC12